MTSKDRECIWSLKNRFQNLKCMNASLKYVPTIIVACILHNFCIASGDVGGEIEMDDLSNDRKKEIDSPNLTVSDIQSKNLAKTQREALYQDWMKKHYKP